MNSIRLKSTLPNVFLNREDIVSDIWRKDITLEKGKFYLIEANSGTGKSSLCSYVFGFRNDYRGEILFDEKNVALFRQKDWSKIRRKHITLMWQELRLFPELTAMENVLIKNKLTGYQKKKTIVQWFDMLGISDKTDTKLQLMSFGQQQRVALIRSLCQPFDFIFVDEPISHLDDSNALIMGNLLTEEAKRQGAGVVTTSIGKHIELDYNQIFKL